MMLCSLRNYRNNYKITALDHYTEDICRKLLPEVVQDFKVELTRFVLHV